MAIVESMAAAVILVEIIRNKSAVWKKFCTAFFRFVVN